MASKDREPVTLRIPAEVADWWQKMAEARGVSRNHLVGEFLSGAMRVAALIEPAGHLPSKVEGAGLLMARHLADVIKGDLAEGLEMIDLENAREAAELREGRRGE
ncbi:MAG: hypothetical protein ACFCVE_10135 [Phycisphaerae bacterium]